VQIENPEKSNDCRLNVEDYKAISEAYNTVMGKNWLKILDSTPNR